VVTSTLSPETVSFISAREETGAASPAVVLFPIMQQGYR